MLKLATSITLFIGAASAQGCWKQAYGRGVGGIGSECKAEDKNGLLCYPQCKTGYKGVGPVCWENCDSGFRDDGAFCAKPKPYGRGAGSFK